ncbi:MAG TPA: hypothetical protein VGL11_05935 [Candidatus Binatia bacterium]|jgi:hypothetical protein
MVYVVKFRPKSNRENSQAKVARTLFAESAAKPSVEKAAELLTTVTGGDFLKETIEIRELRDFDPIEVKGQGGTVFNL